MDFKHLVGKEVIWTGEVRDNESGFKDTYLLFSDFTGMVIPDKERGESPSMLDDAKQTLNTVVSESFEDSVSVVALAEILQHPLFISWINKIAAAKEDKEKISKIQALKLPAAEEFDAMVKADVEGLPEVPVLMVDLPPVAIPQPKAADDEQLPF